MVRPPRVALSFRLTVKNNTKIGYLLLSHLATTEPALSMHPQETTKAVNGFSNGDKVPTWQPLFVVGDLPPVKHPYNHDDALEDLPCMHYALELFLNSHMLESEDYCHKSDQKK